MAGDEDAGRTISKEPSSNRRLETTIGINRTFAFLGAINGFLAVGLGAFGAHGLKDKISTANMAVYETAAHYHLVHAVALFALALVPGGIKLVKAAGWLFTVGIVLFSGSLYVLAVTDVKLWGAVTPFGGIAFLAGWLCLAGGTLKKPE